MNLEIDYAAINMSILPGVKEYPLRLMRKDVKDGAIANNYSVDEFIRPFSWYGRTDDVWMRCPSRKIPCNSINIEDVWCAGQLDNVKGHQRISASAPEPTNNPRTHRITNARSCSTENTKSVILLLQLSFVIFVQGSFAISGWKVRRSTYAYPGVSNTCVIMRKSS